MAGMRWVHVPFKGRPAAVGLMSGEIDFAFGATIGLLPQVRGGEAARDWRSPDQAFRGAAARATVRNRVCRATAQRLVWTLRAGGTPPDLVRRIHADGRERSAPGCQRKARESRQRVRDEHRRKSLSLLRAEIGKWTKLVREANIRVE